MALLRYFLLSVLVTAQIAHCAEWKACEKAKLRLLKLEAAQRGGKPVSSKHSRKSTTRQSAAEIDEWLWKNCRSYSYELRALEQSRM